MRKEWTFLSNHAHILIILAQSPDTTLRQMAERVGITERATHRIVSDLVEEGIVQRTSQGRRNHYEIKSDSMLRHPLESHCTVGKLVDLVCECCPDAGSR